MSQMVELSDKDFKAVIIKIFQQAIMNMLEINEKMESPRKGKLVKGKFSEIFLQMYAKLFYNLYGKAMEVEQQKHILKKKN